MEPPGGFPLFVFGEFARLVEPGIAAFTQYNPTLRPDISAEFAHAVYRFGHSMLNPTVERELANGTQVHTPLLGAFTNPALFNNNGSGGNLTGPQAAGAVARGMTGQVGNEMDEFVTNTLRNTLLGQPLDLATLNMLRGRDSGTQPLNGARRALFASTNGDPSLAPYTSWAQFGLALNKAVRQVDGGGHQLRRFVAGVAEHQALVSGALVEVEALAFVDALGDVLALFAVGDYDGAGVGVKADGRIGVADALDGAPGHFVEVDARTGGDFTGQHHQVVLDQCFRGDSGAFVLR
jgi:hypothetical protein